MVALALSACAGKRVENVPNEGTLAQVTGAMDSDSGQAEGLESIHFDYRATQPMKSELYKIKNAADLILSHKSWIVQIEGHGDQRGTLERNFQIADQRAHFVYQALRKLGVPVMRMNTISYGRTRLLTADPTEAGMARNRRVNFALLLE